jgi:hypothetical protein
MEEKQNLQAKFGELTMKFLPDATGFPLSLANLSADQRNIRVYGRNFQIIHVYVD